MTHKMMKATMAVVVAGAVALPASQAAAGTSKTESALIGALIGGVAGAAVGNGKGEAMALGAVAGAALGVAVDKPKYRNGYSYRQPYYGNGRQRAYDGRYYSQPVSRYDYGYDRNGYGYRR